MDFSNLTLKQIDNLDKEIIKKLSFDDFYAFYTRNKELGRMYLVGGKMGSNGQEKPQYARDYLALTTNIDGAWEIIVHISAPDYTENPDIVDEKTFIKTMLELGVSNEKLDEFIKYEVNWDNF